MENNFGFALRQFRTKRNVSLRSCAEQVGISAPYLSDIELGRRHPSERILQEIARVLEVPVDDLRHFDDRLPVEELKRLVSENPDWLKVFKLILEGKYSARQILDLPGLW